jgi:hypothetical protein
MGIKPVDDAFADLLLENGICRYALFFDEFLNLP